MTGKYSQEYFLSFVYQYKNNAIADSIMIMNDNQNRFTSLFILGLLIMWFLPVRMYSQTQSTNTDIYPDTWVGTDALGRKMPTSKEVGALKTDKKRTVGIFYITWHDEGKYKIGVPYKADVTKVLNADPNARKDGKNKEWTIDSYHWGEPEYGYFLSQDEYVIRHDMSMLADAGVDVIVLDVTNAVLYWDEWKVLFRTMEKMKSEGNRVPKFCFWAFNGNVITVVQRLFEGIYKQNKYRDLWLMWDGKPLLLCNFNPTIDANGSVKSENPNYDPDAAVDPGNPHYKDPDYCNKYYTDYTQEVKNFFTMRNMWWGYYEWAGKRYVGKKDNWCFGYQMNDPNVAKLSPAELTAKHDGHLEEAAVTPAQHPISMVGKSWRKSTGEPPLNDKDLPQPTEVPWLHKTVSNPQGYGIYFQDRWNDALKADPDFIFLNDWNEWTAGKYTSGKDPSGKENGPVDFMGRKNPFYFVDQYNSEFNRTIAPMKGGYTDNYYMQMVQNIRRYKGVRPIPECKGIRKMRMDGKFDKWKSVSPEYLDTKGDIEHRNHNGYGGNHYVNDSGRNDIIKSKVAVDAKNVYFYVETADKLSPYTGKNWMLLLIDADHNSDTGWYGYDYIVNYKVNDSHSTTLMRYDQASKKWRFVKNIVYRQSGSQMELSVPRRPLGLKGDTFCFDFKWADHPADLKNPISFCTNGDTAPNRRFNYRCIWIK